MVEDDHDIADLLEHSLDKAGFRVDVFRRGDSAAAAIVASPPDLILLDLALPGLDGLELCKQLKRQDGTAHVPLVMLTARTEETDRIIGRSARGRSYAG